MTIISSVMEPQKVEAMKVMKWGMHSLPSTWDRILFRLTLRRADITFVLYQCQKKWNVGVCDIEYLHLSHVHRHRLTSSFGANLGWNGHGQLGIGCEWTEQFGDALPTLTFGTGFVPQSMGLGCCHSCFVSMNATMVCFGLNSKGQVCKHNVFCLECFPFSYCPSARIRRRREPRNMQLDKWGHSQLIRYRFGDGIWDFTDSNYVFARMFIEH